MQKQQQSTTHQQKQVHTQYLLCRLPELRVHCILRHGKLRMHAEAVAAAVRPTEIRTQPGVHAVWVSGARTETGTGTIPVHSRATTPHQKYSPLLVFTPFIHLVLLLKSYHSSSSLPTQFQMLFLKSAKKLTIKYQTNYLKIF